MVLKNKLLSRSLAVEAVFLCVFSIALLTPSPNAKSNSDDSGDYYNLSLEELMDIKIECDGKKNV